MQIGRSLNILVTVALEEGVKNWGAGHQDVQHLASVFLKIDS
jgi:hypothetical protein